MENKKSKTKTSGDFFLKVFLIILSSLLIWLSNPNYFFIDGLGFIAWVHYLPIYFLIKKSKLSQVPLIGAVYGALSYGLCGYWLNTFHPLGLIILCTGYLIIDSVLFTVLKWADLICRRNAWLLEFLIICAYEYLKTLGFFGISYCVTAYTQWKYLPLIQISSVIGVFGLNLLIIFPSAFLYSLISKKKQKRILYHHVDSERNSHISAYVKKEQDLADTSLTLTYFCGIIWCIFFVTTLIYGHSALNKKTETDYVTVAAIQNNENPWDAGIESYSKNVRNLIQLTEEALDLSSDIDFVVWPETAVVPSIVYNYEYGNDVRRYQLISQLLNFIDESDSVFVIGNSNEIDFHGVEKRYYNSALVFESGKNVHPPEPGIYSKIKLVPFSESFPLRHTFPSFYVQLLNGGSYMWEQGSDYTVFDYRGLKFSTPICFEDQFGPVCRQMVLNGARCIINLSNDSWSKSVSCQHQHLAMSVFRSVENRIPSVRSTASGVSCIIDQNGKIVKEAPEFCPAYVIGKVPVIKNEEQTLYTRFGDLAGMAESGLASLILIIQTIIVIIKKIRK